MTEELSKEKSDAKEKELAAKKEDERLDELVNTYFKNSMNPVVSEDEIGLNMGLSQPVNKKKEEVVGKVEQDKSEEEVFLIHDNGQITSEVKESHEKEAKEGSVVFHQSIVEKAIYNKAVKNIYKKIEEYQDSLNQLSNTEETSTLSRLIEKSSHSFLTNIRGYRSELNATGFSQYADIPTETIGLNKIKTKELRKAVDLEVEKITIKLINGGIE